MDLKNQELVALQHKIDLSDMQSRQSGNSLNKKISELEKLNALIE